MALIWHRKSEPEQSLAPEQYGCIHKSFQILFISPAHMHAQVVRGGTRANSCARAGRSRTAHMLQASQLPGRFPVASSLASVYAYRVEFDRKGSQSTAAALCRPYCACSLRCEVTSLRMLQLCACIVKLTRSCALRLSSIAISTVIASVMKSVRSLTGSQDRTG